MSCVAIFYFIFVMIQNSLLLYDSLKENEFSLDHIDRIEGVQPVIKYSIYAGTN